MNLSTRNPQPATRNPIFNALTIDVEDYYMVSAFADIVKFEDWPKYESRVERNTRTIIELLDEFKVTATFFILGWVAERHAGLVKDIHAAGHEVACHGYNHTLIYKQTPQEFRGDIRKSKKILEDITGTAVLGYRAASYSIVRETLWALDIMVEEGYKYDSSIFPVHHDRYGLPEAERFPHCRITKTGSIWEIPPSTLRILGQNFPVAGGGYLRFFPLWLTTKALQRINEVEGQPAILYLHPWEIDPEQPRIDGSLLSRIRHYLNLVSTQQKLRTLLHNFSGTLLSSFITDGHRVNNASIS